VICHRHCSVLLRTTTAHEGPSPNAHAHTYQHERCSFGYVNFAARGVAAEGRLVAHRHASGLFWGHRHATPYADPSASGRANLGHLVRDSQLARMSAGYRRVLGLRHVYLEPAHSHFHEYRKMAR
jgi:hypothetical protein